MVVATMPARGPVPTVPPTMVPATSVLPDDVLPTERLNGRAMPTRPLRDELRRIPTVRNVFTVAGALIQTFGVVAAAVVIDTWWAWSAAFLLMGRGHCLLNILGHEAAHRLLFPNRRANDVVGRWLLAYPSYQAFLGYRRAHFAHHRDEMGPNEPDAALYAGYPITRDSWHRKLRRDIVGESAYKNFKGLFRGIRARNPEALQILAVQVVLLGGSIAVGEPLAYLVWIGSWSTIWKLSNRVRSIAEHGGLERHEDKRRTTHVIRQTWLARFTIVPYHTGWHLAHHVDMGVPWRNLPALHDELVAAGWITPEIEYPSYWSFWRACSSGPPRVTAADATAERRADARSSFMDFA